MSVQLAEQLTQALNSIASAGTPYVLESINLSGVKANVAAGNIPKDFASLLKELTEINKLLRQKSQQNRKLQNASAICTSLLTLDSQSAWETVFEHVNLLDAAMKADTIVQIIETKQHDLPENQIVQLLNLVLSHFENLKFSAQKQANYSAFAQTIFSKNDIHAGFTLITSLFTTSVTKNTLIKELRKQPVIEMVKLLEALLILLQNDQISSQIKQQYALLPTFEQVCEWVEVLVDAYYLNFCLKEEWKDLLEKIDQQIESRIEACEQIKAFTDSCDSYQKCKENIQKAANKIDSKFYVKSIYL